VRTRLILAAVCILILPLWFSTFPAEKHSNFAPFAAVALAGHTVSGGWCECGAPGCICDPGELGQSNKPVSDQIEKPSHQSASPTREHSRSGFDFGSGALILTLSLFLWTRLRA